MTILSRQPFHSEEMSDRATSVDVLTAWVGDARLQTLQLVADLDEQQLMGPSLPTINPLLWEIGHAAWFQEHWVLQHAGKQDPIFPDGDNLFDSISVEHDVRWNLPLPSRSKTLQYAQQVGEAVVDLLEKIKETKMSELDQLMPQNFNRV